MILYLDTSSLVKLYVDEADSEAVRGWSQQADVVATSQVALPEAVAAFARRWRTGDIDDANMGALQAQLREDWKSYAVVEIDAETAADLASRHPLRGLDAIHVSASLTLLRVSDDPMSVVFSSFDRQQLDAARAEGLRILDPGDDTADEVR